MNHVGERTSIQEITDRYVKVDENTRARPRPSNAKIYRELQEIQDDLSKSLRRSFRRHREYLNKYAAGLWA